MTGYMKNVKKLLAVILAAALLCGCSEAADLAGTLIHGITAPTWKELRKQGLELCEKTMASVSAGEAGDLYELFCDNNKNEELRAGINGFLKSIGNKINSYGEITQINEPVHFVRDSVDYAIMRFEVDDINIDGESIYSADVILCPYSYYDRKCTGVQYLAIYSGDDLVCKAGNIIEYYEPQKIPSEFTPIDKADIFSDPINTDFASSILYCLDTNDKERFLSLFTESKKTEAADKYTEISALIGEGLQSYSMMNHDGLGKGTFKYDHYEKLSNNIEIYDILTNDGKLLEIDLYACLIDLDEPSKEGISYFQIKHLQKETNDKLGHDVISGITIE